MPEPLTPEVLPQGFELIELPGHFFSMVGFRTPTMWSTWRTACPSKETLDKYQIGVLYDVGAYLDTLEKVKTMQAKCFVPSHAAPTEDIAPLAQYNIDKVQQIATKILDLCAAPALL